MTIDNKVQNSDKFTRGDGIFFMGLFSPVFFVAGLISVFGIHDTINYSTSVPAQIVPLNKDQKIGFIVDKDTTYLNESTLMKYLK